MIDTVRAARAFFDARPGDGTATPVLNGFTGSAIWHSFYSFPPTPPEFWERGYRDFAALWTPILDACERAGVNFALEVHLTEIAFDLASAGRAVAAVGGHRRFGFNMIRPTSRIRTSTA